MKTILIADDEPSVLAITSLIIRSAGYETVEAANGVEALEKFESTPIDGLVSDIHMPQMDGIELALHVRKQAPNLPVLLMSGFANTGKNAGLELFEIERVRFLPKPFLPGQLRDLLRSLFEA
jgi:CheY-like chemotaxis protein